VTLLAMQAAAEYLAPTFQRGVSALKVTIRDISDFVASPRGILVAGLIIFLLAVTVGRRRKV
jgi:hypothetical protein